MDWLNKKSSWLNESWIKPYVFVRPENQIKKPGSLHSLAWFREEPIIKNPLHLTQLEFAEHIYQLEGRAFGPSGMAMPRWVFYDCAIMPGFVAGFAALAEAMPPAMRSLFQVGTEKDWVPISLFIIIPTMNPGEWVAHNLCSVNSLLPKAEQLYGLGFLSKAFGLWYANVETCCGFTQWSSGARKLHSHYGAMEILSAYTPVHSHAETLTYRVRVDTASWEKFYSGEVDKQFERDYVISPYQVEPASTESLKKVQEMLESGKGPFYLSAREISSKSLTETLNLYLKKG